jgi:hypothetical protein
MVVEIFKQIIQLYYALPTIDLDLNRMLIWSKRYSALSVFIPLPYRCRPQGVPLSQRHRTLKNALRTLGLEPFTITINIFQATLFKFS